LRHFKIKKIFGDISKLKKSLQEEILSHVCKKSCKICGGSGLNPKALASKINGLNIVDFMNLPVSDLLKILEKIQNSVGISISKQISENILRMIEVGIGYLNLGRKTDTLSGGELQRIKIVRNLAGSLTNITYIFDEPTSGLHPADAEKIEKILLDLRDKNNNVLVVEHNRQIIEIADHIIELGKFAGTNGGNIIFEGNLKNLLKADTFTAKILNQKIKINENPKSWSEYFFIKNASVHNLKNFDVKIPKNILTAITGVAGSGKSSLARYEFVKNYPEAIVIDQKPIGTSIRSNSATYIGIMDEIRNIFAKENNVKASLFSFNSDGACKVCKGTWQIVYDMAFAEPVTVICEECFGKRYDKKILEYKYKGKNIEEILNLTVEQAQNFFESEKIKNILEKMTEVGLEYLTLGQPTNSLSGGELQRIKLVSELNKSGKIYILDEPSNGLSGKDIEKLIKLLRKLVEKNNTVIIVEHRLEIISQADWIIDIGPGGGSDGGEIIFEGTPKNLIKCEESKTAKFLNKLL